MTVPTGNYGSIGFAYEDSFGVENTSGLMSFGYGVRLNGLNEQFEMRPVYNIGSPYGKAFVIGRYQGSFSVQGYLTDDALFEAVFGNGSKTVTTLDDGSTVDTYECKPEPKSFTTVVEVYPVNGAGLRRVMRGCLLRSASISARVGDAITFRSEVVFQKARKEMVTSEPTPIEPTVEGIPTFATAKLTFAGLTDLIVQDFSINMNLGSNLVYALGSVYPVDMYRGRVEISGRLTALLSKDDLFDLFYSFGYKGDNVSEGLDKIGTVNKGLNATLELGIDTNGDGVNERYFKFTVSDIAINRIGHDLEVGELVMLGTTFSALLASAEYKG